MSLGLNLLLLAALILVASFFSIAEIALAASRRLRLKQLADEGDIRAEKVLRVQEQPGHYFTVIRVVAGQHRGNAGFPGFIFSGHVPIHRTDRSDT
jgi:CBS domain containing-hemolysin-like protein